jgi:phosphoribosyl 1,2-cyclic phosphodiesterase
MRFAVLSSGSKANCTYLENQGTAILIDCGLSAKETERRLVALGINPASINAIVVTHEHSDHIMGLSVFSRRYKIPVYANKSTSKHFKPIYAKEHIKTGEKFVVGSLEIESFSIVHDASDPVGYVINGSGIKFAQATDLGRVTQSVKHALVDSIAIVLESNHDQEMLANCDYPWELKQRIASSHGHLSNDCAGALLQELSHNDLNYVVLAHLSENSNRPDIALNTVKSYLENDTKFHLSAAGVAFSTAMFDLHETAEFTPSFVASQQA